MRHLSVGQTRPRWIRSGAGAPELQIRGMSTSAGDRPPRYGNKNVPFTVGRGPVPRHATIAGDRPPRYGPGRKKTRGTSPRAPVTEPLCRARAPALAHCDQAIANYRGDGNYSRCFTSPNVVNIRFDAETGPRNIRNANASRLPPNETSSIW